jgi:hypothetical protein
MAQRLCLVTAIGKQGGEPTAHRISATLVRTTNMTWVLNGRIRGTAPNNGGASLPVQPRTITAVGASTKSAKQQADRMLRMAAANFLKIHESQLVSMSTKWVDESD